MRFGALEEKRALEAKPFRAVLELTHRCNFRCVHCYESNHERTDELSTSDWMKVLDQLRDAGVLYLTFSGGEFLLRPDHAELCAYARKNGFFLRIFTNASLITERIINLWRGEGRPHEVEVSLYGASEDTYRQVTGTAKGFSQAQAGLERLERAGFPVLAKVVVLRQNVAEVDQMRSMAERHGFRVAVSGKLTVRDDGSSEPLRHQVGDYEWKHFDENHEENRFAVGAHADQRPCNAGRSSLAIGPNGDVFPCVDMRVPVGNLMTQSLQEIWGDGELLDGIREVRNRDFVYPEGMNYERARPPCMAQNVMNTGSLVQIHRPPSSSEVLKKVSAEEGNR